MDPSIHRVSQAWARGPAPLVLGDTDGVAGAYWLQGSLQVLCGTSLGGVRLGMTEQDT